VIRWWCQSWSANTTGSGFNKPSQTPTTSQPSPCSLCVLCAALLYRAVIARAFFCDSASLDCLLCISVPVACSCYRVVACVCLVHCVATPILDCLPACLANCISPRAPRAKIGQQDRAFHLQSQPTWGMYRCSTSTVDTSRAYSSRSEPRGLSHILNPSSSGETKQHVVSGRPFGAYEENGRLYHSWRRGIYPYPTDEVSYAASPVA
jgi:hypothetical protein